MVEPRDRRLVKEGRRCCARSWRFVDADVEEDGGAEEEAEEEELDD